MYVIPAIDLLGGKCVRLIQGQYHRFINYEDNPVKKAEEFLAAGAEWLHIIDLDGAKIGKPVNTEAVERIMQVEGLKVELGGGLRDKDSIKQMLDMGVERVIIGTQAVSDFNWFTDVVETFAGRIVLSLDSRGSKVATHGWKQESSQRLIDFASTAAKLPLAAIIYTDITKDGMLAGPNFERTKTLAEAVEVPVIAAGGVTQISDVTKLAETGVVAAAIIGRALYEDTMDLAEAIKAVSQ